MNVYTAVRFFSEPVQAWMESKGYNDTAEFVQLVHIGTKHAMREECLQMKK